jgi:hypothetical protein
MEVIIHANQSKNLVHTLQQTGGQGWSLPNSSAITAPEICPA